MKKIFCFSFMFVMAVVMFSCSDDEFVNETNEVKVTGSLSQSSSRTVYTEGTSSVSVTWESGDIIGLISPDQSTVFQYAASSSGSTTDFESVNSLIANNEGDDFYAWYPYSASTSNTYPNAAIPDITNQSYTSDIPNDLDFIIAEGEIADNTLSLSFSHMFSFLKITIDSSLLDGCQGFVITGDKSISYTDAVYDFSNESISGTSSSNIYYNIDEATLSEEEITCYVAFDTSNGVSEINVYKYEQDGTYSDLIVTKESSSSGFTSGCVYTMSIEAQYINVDKESVEVSVDGGEFSFTVTSNIEYEVSSNVDWITIVSETSGTYTFSVEATSSTGTRSGTVTITGEGITKEVTITQEAAYIEVSESAVEVSATGETVNLTISANVEYTVSANVDWITLYNDSGTLSITVAATESTSERSGTVTISGSGISVEVAVTQEGAYITVSTTEFSLDFNGGTISFTVKSNVDYTVSTTADWISQTSKTTSSGTTTFKYSVDVNESTATRTATITVSWGSVITKTITVSQTGAVSTDTGGIDDLIVEEW